MRTRRSQHCGRQTIPDGTTTVIPPRLYPNGLNRAQIRPYMLARHVAVDPNFKPDQAEVQMMVKAHPALPTDGAPLQEVRVDQQRIQERGPPCVGEIAVIRSNEPLQPFWIGEVGSLQYEDGTSIDEEEKQQSTAEPVAASSSSRQVRPRRGGKVAQPSTTVQGSNDKQDDDDDDDDDEEEDDEFSDDDGDDESADDSDSDSTFGQRGRSAKRKASKSKGRPSKRQRILNKVLAAAAVASKAGPAQEVNQIKNVVSVTIKSWWTFKSTTQVAAMKLNDGKAWDRYMRDKYKDEDVKQNANDTAPRKKAIDDWNAFKAHIEKGKFYRIPEPAIERFRSLAWLVDKKASVDGLPISMEAILWWGSRANAFTNDKKLKKKTFDDIKEDLTEETDLKHNMARRHNSGTTVPTADPSAPVPMEE